MSPQADWVRVSLKFATEIWWGLGSLVALSVLAGCDDRSESGIDAVVTGNSMTPAFWGVHVRSECDRCRYSFRVSGRKVELPEKLVCPNCGFRSLNSSEAVPHRAQAVRIEPEDQRLDRPLHRWDVVATRESKNRPAMIKRVVGLPGESIRFSSGDIYADGSIVRKPLSIAREMRVPVFDSRYSCDDVLRRFQSLDDAAGWKVVDGSWQYAPSPESIDVEWLAYEQWRCVASHLPQDQSVPVEDWYAENVGVSRNLNATNDIWVELECRIEHKGQFDLKLNHGSAFHVLKFDFFADSVSYNGQVFSFSDLEFSSPAVGSGSKVTIEVCTFDRHLTVLVSGKNIVSIDFPAGGNPTDSLLPVQIGCRESTFELTRFRLWRDVYYFDAVPDRNSNGSIELRAGADEYLLLGDNVPRSIDSRHWSAPAVPADQILGRVSLPWQ